MTPCRSHPKSRAQGLRTSRARFRMRPARRHRSEEHTSELQSLTNLVCRLLLEKKKKKRNPTVLIIQSASLRYLTGSELVHRTALPAIAVYRGHSSRDQKYTGAVRRQASMKHGS